MEDVKGYQQLPGIPACKKCCLLQRGKKISWFSSGKQGTRIPRAFQTGAMTLSSALPVAQGADKTVKNPPKPRTTQGSDDEAVWCLSLAQPCVLKQNEVTAGESQGYSSISGVHEDALPLYFSKVVCRLKNCKKEGNF